MAGSEPPGTAVDRRQLLLVAVAVLALVVAAFLAPVSPDRADAASDRSSDGGSSSSGSSGGDGRANGNGDGSGGGDGGGIGGSGVDGGGGGGSAVTGDGDLQVGWPGGAVECGLVFYGQPVPGSVVPVEVVRDGDPVPGATVWFSGERIGRTGPRGRVTGRVPYERPLEVRVDFPDGRACRSTRSTPDGAPVEEVAADLGPGAAVRTTVEGNGSTATVTVRIRARIAVEVIGEQFPGRTVTVRASLGGVPVADGRVSVDGEAVGRTDADGEYDLRLPDDDTDRITLRIERGDFARTVPMRVLDLDATVSPAGLLALPGAPATVLVERGARPFEGATVTADGGVVGRSGPNGTVDLRLPVDPGSAVTARTDRQTASADVLALYGGTALVVGSYLLVVAALAGVAVRSRGRRAGRGVAAGGLAVLSVAVGHAYAGTAGALAVALPLAVAAVLWVGYRRRGTVAAEGRSLAAFVGSVPRWLAGAVLGAARWLEPVAAAVGTTLARAGRWLAGQPRSVSALARRLAAWIGGVPGRARRVVGWRGAVAAAAALAVAAAGYRLGGRPGLAVALCAVLVAAALVYGRRHGDDDAESEVPAGGETAPARESTTATDTDSGDERPSLRERWRTFARWVRPRRWRVSAPGEVERDARTEGYPEDAVRTLTAAFRETEYGRRPTERVRDRAEQAYQRLADHREGGDRE